MYSSLLKVRDPEAWQRIFEPASMHSLITSTPQQHATAPVNHLTWLLRKAERGLRSLLAVPDSADLRNYSSKHPHAQSPNTMTYKSNIGVLGPNISSRPLNASEPKTPRSTSTPTPTIQSSLSRSFAIHDQPRPSTQTERTARLTKDPVRIKNNAAFDHLTRASPRKDRLVKASRSRGYEDGAFVTIIAPSACSTERGEETCWV